MVLAGAIFFDAPSAFTGATATQTVTMQVLAINELSVTGNPGTLTVNTATAGSEPSTATDASTSYAITTNEAKKITGVLNTAMPANTTLKVNLVAPTGGTSAGDVTLTDSAANLVTGIDKKAESAKTVTYKFSATVAAGPQTSFNRTVTLTIATE